MSTATLILGNSGTGKSTSLRNLDPAKTLLIQCIKKPLPFRAVKRNAAQATIDRIGGLGGDGGLIALDREGNIVAPFNSQGMKRAWLTTDGEVGV